MGCSQGTGPRATVSRRFLTESEGLALAKIREVSSFEWVVCGGQAPALRYGDGWFAGDRPPRCGIAAVFHGKRGPGPRQDSRGFIRRARACPSPSSPEKIIGEISFVGRGPVPRHLHPKKNRCNRFENYGIIFFESGQTRMRESYRDARLQTAPTGFVRILPGCAVANHAYGIC